MNIQMLRQETEADHRAAEDALSLMDPGLSKMQYVDSLSKLYEIVAAWEEKDASLAPNWLQALMVSRNRLHLLQRDLLWFGVPRPTRRATLPPLSDLASFMGAMYVMEGSTLGGQIIARQVSKTLSLTDCGGAAFFHGRGSETGSLWKGFCAMLTTRITDEEARSVSLSAKAMFGCFTKSIQEKSDMNDN